MKPERKRFKVRTNLAGSSEVSRLKSAKAIRELNHKAFSLVGHSSEIVEEVARKPKAPKMVEITLWGGIKVTITYAEYLEHSTLK